jgi:tryptophan synthase beta subunit
VAQLRKLGPTLARSAIVIVSLSGRGDKDAPQVRDILRGRRESSDA